MERIGSTKKQCCTEKDNYREFMRINYGILGASYCTDVADGKAFISLMPIDCRAVISLIDETRLQSSQ